MVNQTRSFLYIDECIEATCRLDGFRMYRTTVNIGSEEMVTINQLVDIAAEYCWKRKIYQRPYVDGPLGVRGRNSNNDLIRERNSDGIMK